LFNNVAVFSISPLLQKDGQTMQYLVLTLFWNYLVGYNPVKMPNSIVKVVSLSVYGIIALLHLAEWTVAPPSRYPDIYAVLNVLVCTPVFGLCWLWGMKRQLEVGWAITSLRESNTSILMLQQQAISPTDLNSSRIEGVQGVQEGFHNGTALFLERGPGEQME